MGKIIFLSFVVFLMACRTTKKIGNPAPERTKEELITALNSRNINFEWLNVKAKTSIESPDETGSADMILRMRKDSIIWIVIKKFGIEAARIQVDKKEYTMLYRLEGLYETNSIDKVNELFSLSADFNDMQQLLFGNVLLPDSAMTQVVEGDNFYLLSALVDGLAISYKIDGYTLELRQISITDALGRTAEVYYDDYRPVDGFGSISMERKFVFPVDGGIATMKLKVSEIEINVPKEIKFNIPKSYERI